MSTADDENAGPEISPRLGYGLPAAINLGSLLGSYEIVRKIGEGGMGIVWEARHGTLRKRVAIKTLKPEVAMNADFVARFVREGRAAARIRHPNAVDVADVGVENGIPYLVMDLLEGESLADRITQSGPVPVKEAADMMVPILLALATAHDEGIIHRDMKPENVFLAKSRDGTVTPTLLDFGVSKLSGEANLTQSSTFMGTPYYMSPEQANDSKSVDVRTDVYSMGVMLYEALAGTKPFDGASLIVLVRLICDGEYLPLDAAAPHVPMEVVDIVQRAMNKDPALRYTTARALATALIPFASTRVRGTFGPTLGYEEASYEPRSGVTDVRDLRRQLSPVPSPVPPPRKSHDAVAMAKTIEAETSLVQPNEPNDTTRPGARMTTTVKLIIVFAGLAIVFGTLAIWLLRSASD
ncbi:MAG: serine/threonine protein kinase [Sandaracinaceae bacterium]|jgi:serine/threonine protein kinase|nr:serine/threonine protein kinase [Sandaracinaceae bacterium]